MASLRAGCDAVEFRFAGFPPIIQVCIRSCVHTMSTSKLHMEKRLTGSNFKPTFLTDSVKLTEEAPEINARRADFIQEVLQPVFSLFQTLQQDCKELDRETHKEVLAALLAMKSSAERKFQAAGKKLMQAQRRLEELDEAFEREDAVVTIRREIELYSDKIEKMKSQYSLLRDQNSLYKSTAAQLATEIQTKTAVFNAESMANIDLHRSISAFSWPKQSKTLNLPLQNILKIIPFEVFTELSARDVGLLSISQIQAFVRYKKHLESLKLQVERVKTESQSKRIARKKEGENENLETIFMKCVNACRSKSDRKTAFPPSISLSGVENLFPLATISDFKTLHSSRLFEIQKTHRDAIRRRRQQMVSYSREEMNTVPGEFLLRVMVEREDCVERLKFFITHPNPFRCATPGAVTEESRSRLNVE